MAEQCRWKWGSLVIQGGVEMSQSRGVNPDMGSLVQPVGDTQPSAAVADLILEWGDPAVSWTEVRRWKNCLLKSPRQIYRPYRDIKYEVYDRRWRWQFKYVHGSYNVLDAKGFRIVATRKTPRELATLLLDALGETGYDVTALSTDPDLAPEVSWAYANAAIELQKLCELSGLTVHLDADDKVRLKAAGTGTTPATTYLSEPIESCLAVEQQPEKIRAFAAETLFDSWLELEPCAPEIGGTTSDDSDIKALEDLSFMPTGGWHMANPETFAEMTGATDDIKKLRQEHCRKYIWKMFRIRGFAGGATKPPGYDADIDPDTSAPYADVTNMKLLLPLEPSRLQAGVDADGQYRRMPAELAGSFARTEYPGQSNLAKYSVWAEGFRIDVANGFVYTNKPCFRWTPVVHTYPTNGDMLFNIGYTPTAQDVADHNLFKVAATGFVYRCTAAPNTFALVKAGAFRPILVLRTGYGVRKDIYGGRYHHFYEYTTGVTNGLGTEPLRKTEVRRIVVENYTQDYKDLTVRGAEYDNKTTVETRLSDAITQYRTRYQPTLQPQTGKYVAPVSQDTNGIVAQVSWSGGPESAFMQQVSVHWEHDFKQRPAEQKAKERNRAKADRDSMQAFTAAQFQQLIQQQLVFQPTLFPLP